MASKVAALVRLVLYAMAFIVLARVLGPEPIAEQSDPDGPFFWLVEWSTALLAASFCIGLLALIAEVALRLGRRSGTRC